MKRLYLLFILSIAWSPGANADIHVVVNKATQLTSMDKEQISAFFMGKKRTYPDGTMALVIERGSKSEIRERFFFALNQMPLSRVNAYWSRLKFSGRLLPPSVVESDQDVLHVLASNPNAISYINFLPEHDQILVVHTFSEE